MAGLLHDLGKHGDRFQARLRGEEAGLDHWSPGAWALLLSGALPEAEFKPRCDGCSLSPICMPGIVPKKGRVSRYLREVFAPIAAEGGRP